MEARNITTGPTVRPARPRVAFLLSQVGALAATQFSDRLTDLGLQPADVGILRLISINPPMSQQTLAGHLGVGASRVVALIDKLEKDGLVIRERSTKDRRNHELHLTPTGETVMTQMRAIGTAHEEDLVSVLNPSERETLSELLTKVAASHGLDPEIHPGYRARSDQPPANEPSL